MNPTNSQFVYLLNAMEAAAQENNPAEHGYAEKRRAVLYYVAKLESARPEARDSDAIKLLREVKGALPPWLAEYKRIADFLARSGPQEGKF